ncbi:hypothetical protein BV898_16458 [Hypsibius exemplaris]|uniref:Uncharacterized protein n=1 Tax=Hypsibius exemplaris TaxID=2072580 RepID=A0A9X6NDA1_HYPEX|nr:hypothetical protein BV898_16458 [Hypsibius exemplaris]
MGTDVPDPLDPVLEKFVYMSIVRAASDFLKRNASVASLAEEVCLSRDESQNLVLRLCADQILLERDRLTKIVSTSSAALKALLSQIVAKAKSA